MAPPVLEAAGIRASLLVFGAAPVVVALLVYPLLVRLGEPASRRTICS